MVFDRKSGERHSVHLSFWIEPAQFIRKYEWYDMDYMTCPLLILMCIKPRSNRGDNDVMCSNSKVGCRFIPVVYMYIVIDLKIQIFIYFLILLGINIG